LPFRVAHNKGDEESDSKKQRGKGEKARGGDQEGRQEAQPQGGRASILPVSRVESRRSAPNGFSGRIAEACSNLVQTRRLQNYT